MICLIVKNNNNLWHTSVCILTLANPTEFRECIIIAQPNGGLTLWKMFYPLPLIESSRQPDQESITVSIIEEGDEIGEM